MGKVFSYKTMLNDEGIPHMVKEQEYDCQNNYMYDNTAEMADFIMWNLKLQLYAEEIVYVIAFQLAFNSISVVTGVLSKL